MKSYVVTALNHMIPPIFKYARSFERDFSRRATARRRSPEFPSVRSGHISVTLAMVSSNDITKAERARRHAQSRQDKQRNRRERDEEQLRILNRALYREAENRRQATLRREFESRQQEGMSWNGFDHEVAAAPDVPPKTLLGEIAG